MPSRATCLFAATGFFALLISPAGTLLATILIVVGAAAGMGRVLTDLPPYLRAVRIAAGLSVAALSGAAIYVMSGGTPVAGWVALILSGAYTKLVYLLIPVLFLMPNPVTLLRPLFAFLLRPLDGWRKAEKRRPHEFVIIISIALSAAVLVGFTAKVGQLPGVALGSVLVLRMERAAALFAALLVVFTVLAYAWKGILPSEFSSKGFRYEQVKETTRASLVALETANEQATVSIAESKQDIEGLEGQIGKLSERIKALLEQQQKSGSAPPRRVE